MRTESKISLAILLVLGIVFFLFMTQKTRSSSRAPSPTPVAKTPPPSPAPGALATTSREEARAQDERRHVVPASPEPARPLPYRSETPQAGASREAPAGDSGSDAGARPAGWAAPPSANPVREALAAASSDLLKPPTATPAAPAAGAARTHTIQEGESLWSISLQYYGKGVHHGLIQDANRALIPDPNVLPVGTTIQIPDLPAGGAAKTARTAKVAAAPKAPPAADPIAPAAVASAPRASADGKRLYTISRGDTLEKIAKHFYGSRERKFEIQAANQIADPDRIWEGQVLVIPE